MAVVGTNGENPFVPTSPVQQALAHFAETLTANFAVAEFAPAQAEDQLKGPTQELLRVVGAALGFEVIARTEARTELGVRPDLGVTVNSSLTGHVELKAPGKGVRERNFTTPHDREQFKKLRDHPNLLYSDANEWALYREGALVGSVVTAGGDVRVDGEASFEAPSADALQMLLLNFFTWRPLVPSTPKALAKMLAPLTRLLRENVRTALSDPDSALSHLAEEWRRYFFPEADDAQFADAYAQTLTYALLLARVEGETDLHARAVERLERRHGLLSQVLRWLAEPAAREEVEVPVDLLERSIGAVDPAALSQRARDRDPWLYFYEDFLADPKLRKQRGVYFTPPAVVQAQTTLVLELLRERFDKPLAFADDGVTILDPAVGTGTYLIAAVGAGLDSVREAFGTGDVSARATVMADNVHGFELLIGPYAVAHLRVSQALVGEAEAELPSDGLHIYLTDTLESPIAPHERERAPLFHAKLAEEHERARRVKANVPILVCIGNPPYFRQVIDPSEEGVERQGGWVRRGDEGEEGILADFLRGAPGVHAKNLYNLYVYFWRWALWKVCENPPRRGIVSFITASSYLRGPGFVGMRRYMREVFDELWILDLGGDNRGPRQSENVFDIQTPVAIAVGVRDETANSETPARVLYSRIEGSREAKYEALLAIEGFSSVEWQECFSDWTSPFLPKSVGDFFSWPLLTDLFPWQHSGVQFKRTWPIAPDRETLVRRWDGLLSAPEAERAELFRETRDRKVSRSYPPLGGTGRLAALARLPSDAESPAPVPYAYRSFDRQFCLPDNRLGDFLRPALWRTASARQLYMTSLLTGLLGPGPAAVVTNLVPDLDHFRGSFGAKHVILLYRDAEARRPNITQGVLETLSGTLGIEVAPEALFAYCYALLSAPGYVERFMEDLEVPGPHLPLTRDRRLFETSHNAR